MAPLIRLGSRANKPSNTKLATSSIKEQAVHLALVSPPPSDRPTAIASCEEVKKTGKTSPKGLSAETSAINELIKQTEGGKNMNTLRERRRSKDYEVKMLGKTIATAKPCEDAVAINDLLKQVNEAKLKGKSVNTVHRERRRSKDEVMKTDADAATRFQETGNTGSTGIGGSNRLAKMRWKEAAAAVMLTATDEDTHTSSDFFKLNQDKVVHSAEHDVSLTKTLHSLDEIVKSAPSTAKLTGAAARGTQAAALNRIKKAASVVGGVYLTAAEWDAIKSEMALLQVQNTRLTAQVAKLRETEAHSPNSRRFMPTAVAKAIDMVSSPMGRRSISRYGAVDITESPSA